MARPSKYRPEFAQQAEKLCALGATDLEVADFFGVNVCTINRWKGEYPEFCNSLKTAKEIADTRVERSLFSRATGYEHNEVDIRVVNGEIVQTPIRKFYPPDTVACIFWLKNRKPEEWRDKVEHHVTRQPNPIDASRLTWEQREQLRELMLAAMNAPQQEAIEGEVVEGED